MTKTRKSISNVHNFFWFVWRNSLSYAKMQLASELAFKCPLRLQTMAYSVASLCGFNDMLPFDGEIFTSPRRCCDVI